MRSLLATLCAAVLPAFALVALAAPAHAADNSLTTSDVVECGQITITLRNVSPWIYPVSVYIDGATDPVYGPTVDNRSDTDGDGAADDFNGPQKDATASKTYTFPEDSGTHTVRYVVDAGSESDLYKNSPAGQSTTRTIDTDCAPDNSLTTSDDVKCGQITITLRNVSPWIYPVSVYIDGATDPEHGPTVDNRTDTDSDGKPDFDGPQKDQTASKTYTFPEDSGTHTVRYVVDAGSESDLYKNSPAGQSTTRTIDTDCETAASAASSDDDAALPDTGSSTPWWQWLAAALTTVVGGGLALLNRRPRGRHALI